MPARSPRSLALVALLTLAACRSSADEAPAGATGGSGGGGRSGTGGAPGPSVTKSAAQACEAMARADCEGVKRCDPQWFRFAYEDLNGCLSSRGNDCKHELSLADTDYTVADV